MPYKSLQELPENVRSHLPLDGQRIYVAAFNCAWEQYSAIEVREDAEKRQKMADQTAWAAVTKAGYQNQ